MQLAQLQDRPTEEGSTDNFQIFAEEGDTDFIMETQNTYENNNNNDKNGQKPDKFLSMSDMSIDKAVTTPAPLPQRTIIRANRKLNSSMATNSPSIRDYFTSQVQGTTRSVNDISLENPSMGLPSPIGSRSKTRSSMTLINPSPISNSESIQMHELNVFQ